VADGEQHRRRPRSRQRNVRLAAARPGLAQEFAADVRRRPEQPLESPDIERDDLDAGALL
jgi:hypothetical protein